MDKNEKEGYFLAFLKNTKKTIALCMVFFLCVASSYANNGSQNKLSLDISNKTLGYVMNYIESNSDYHFFYQNAEVDLAQKISIKEKGDLTKLVNKLFAKTNLKPIFSGKQILLKRRAEKQQKISGYVTYESGEAFEGVNVILNNTKAYATDSFGYYELNAELGDKLVFSHVGFETQEFLIVNQEKINVTMEVATTELEEVVLIGYGEKKAKDIATSITKIDQETLTQNFQSGATFDRALSGLIKGVRVTQGAGRPGTPVDINVRGITSPFNGSRNNPLFVIDGVQFEGSASNFNDQNGAQPNPLLAINPNDIKSISVLKDAGATAIYGSRGANGVIIVETKRGKKGEKTAISFSAKTTMSVPVGTINYLNLEDYKRFVTKLIDNSVKLSKKNSNYARDYLGELNAKFGVTNNEFDAKKIQWGKGNTNWADEVYRKPAITNEASMSLSGGGESTAYSLSLRHVNQEGLLKKDRLKQYNMRLSLDVEPMDILKIGGTFSLSKTINKSGYGAGGNSIDRLNTSLMNFRPDIPVFEKGNLTYDSIVRINVFGSQVYRDEKFFLNPLGVTTKSAQRLSDGLNAVGNVYLELEPLEKLKIRTAVSASSLSTDFSSATLARNQREFQPPYSTSGLSTSIHTISNVITDLTANYNKVFNDVHSFGVFIGSSWNRTYTNARSVNYQGLPDNESLGSLNYARSVNEYKDFSSESGINSLMGRLTYDYSGRYGITLALRSDKSSKFGSGRKQAWFPSIAVNWNVHEESFLSGVEAINQLKFRGSVGVTGSTNLPADFLYLKLYAPVGLEPQTYNGGLALGRTGNLANPVIGWERTNEINLGVDFAFFKERLSGSVDVYQRRTEGVLSGSPFRLETGRETYISNFATVDNKGIEVDLNIGIVRQEDWRLDMGINIAQNINKLVSFNEALNNPEVVTGYEVGREINLIRGFTSLGIYQTQEEVDKLNQEAKKKGHSFYDGRYTAPGDYKIKDVNKDGHITFADVTFIGSNQPDFFGGFNTSVIYKGIELGAFFNFSYGAEMNRSVGMGSNPRKNIEKQFDIDKRWSPKNKTAKLPRLVVGNPGRNERTSTANLFDASYLRFKSLQLGYIFPNKLVSSIGITYLKIYAATSNLYTWTNYPGLDPESVTGAASQTGSFNVDPYPLAKSLTFGLMVNF